MVTTALSLTVLLVCFSLDSDDQCSSRSECMHGVSVQAVRDGATYFPTYKAAACHYARSCACNQSNSCIGLVTIQSRPSDRDAGGAGASGPWPPARPNPPAAGMSYIPIRLYTTLATYHLLLEIYHLFGYGRWYIAKKRPIQPKNAFLTFQGPPKRLYTMLFSLKSAI